MKKAWSVALSRRSWPRSPACSSSTGSCFPGFFTITWQDGRFFGSLIDVLKPRRTGDDSRHRHDGHHRHQGRDLSVGAVMAVAGAVAATCAGPMASRWSSRSPWRSWSESAAGCGTACWSPFSASSPLWRHSC